MKWVRRITVFVGFILLLFSVGLLLVVIYKKEILAEVSSQLKSAVRAEITIGDADITLFSEFPNFTVRLDDVLIKDPSARPGDRDVLRSKSILVNVETYKLFFGEIEFRSVRITDGEFFIFRTKSGYSNLDVFRRKQASDTVSTSDSTRSFRLTNEKLEFRNLHFNYHDSVRQKFIAFVMRDVTSHVSHRDSLVSCSMNGAIDFGELTFNPSQGSFLKDQAANVFIVFNYRKDSSRLVLERSRISLRQSEFDVRGVFDFSPKRSITLDISSASVGYEEGLSVIPATIATNLSQMSVERPFSIDVHLDAFMKPGTPPSVDVRFGLKDNVFKSKVVTITALSLNGAMTNHNDPEKQFDNSNSAVRLDSIRGAIDELPFEARAILTNFNDLSLEVLSRHAVTLPQLNREVDTTSIRFTGGKFVSEFHYKGKLNEYFDQQTGSYTGELEGSSTLEDGSFTVVSRKLQFRDVDMKMRFNEDTVWIDHLGITTGKSSARLQGMITNYVPFFTHPVRKGYVKLKITSPNIDLGNFLVKKRSTKRRSATQVKQDRQKVSDMLDRIFTNLEFDVALSIDKLKNRTFNATRLRGNIKLNGTTLHANNVGMTFGGGRLNLTMTLKDLHKAINPVEVKAKASNIAIKDLFRSFDNFHQKAITDKNLEGRMSFDTRFKIKINDDFDVVLPSLAGEVNMVIKDGRLINVEAIHNMSNFLFKHRDFDDVKFAQINGQVKVQHRDLQISRMEVQSTVLSIFLEGKYSLDNKTDLSIQVPLSNLKKRNKDFVPKNVGVDAKVGPSVFLIAKTNPEGKTDISYGGLRRKKKGKGKN